MKRFQEAGYNERLFSSGLRRRLHLARFLWLRRKLLELKCPSARVIELGCFDGKVIDFLPTKPDYYVGYDANWEGGLSLAEKKWQAHPNYHFRVCTTPEEMDLGEEHFDIAIAMETLEHVPEAMVRPYLEKLAHVTDQYLFITAPNEKGVVFFFKYLFKLFFGDVERHSVADFVNATLGRMHRIERGNHKGFDYDWLARMVSEYFDVIEVSGQPASRLPPALNFTVGIVAKRKTAQTAHGPICPFCGDVAARSTRETAYPLWESRCGAIGSGSPIYPDLDEVADGLLAIAGIPGSVSEPAVPVGPSGMVFGQAYDIPRSLGQLQRILDVQGHQMETKTLEESGRQMHSIWIRRKVT